MVRFAWLPRGVRRIIATNTCGPTGYGYLAFDQALPHHRRGLVLSARASDLPAEEELVQTAVDTGHRRRATNGERRIFIARR